MTYQSRKINLSLKKILLLKPTAHMSRLLQEKHKNLQIVFTISTNLILPKIQLLFSNLKDLKLDQIKFPTK